MSCVIRDASNPRITSTAGVTTPLLTRTPWRASRVEDSARHCWRFGLAATVAVGSLDRTRPGSASVSRALGHRWAAGRSRDLRAPGCRHLGTRPAPARRLFRSAAQRCHSWLSAHPCASRSVTSCHRDASSAVSLGRSPFRLLLRSLLSAPVLAPPPTPSALLGGASAVPTFPPRQSRASSACCATSSQAPARAVRRPWPTAGSFGAPEFPLVRTGRGRVGAVASASLGLRIPQLPSAKLASWKGRAQRLHYAEIDRSFVFWVFGVCTSCTSDLVRRLSSAQIAHSFSEQRAPPCEVPPPCWRGSHCLRAAWHTGDLGSHLLRAQHRVSISGCSLCPAYALDSRCPRKWMFQAAARSGGGTSVACAFERLRPSQPSARGVARHPRASSDSSCIGGSSCSCHGVRRRVFPTTYRDHLSVPCMRVRYAAMF